MEYEVSFSFFIENDDKERFNEVLDALSEIGDIIDLQHYDDGEDYCIDCIATISAKDWNRYKNKNKVIDAIDKVINGWMKGWYAAWDYHYVKANGFYWQP
jgi:hypothetical protein